MSEFKILNGYYVKDGKARDLAFPFSGINPPKVINDFASYQYFQNTLAEPYYTSDGMRSMQGACYIDDLDCFCLAATNSGAGYTDATLIFVDRNFQLLSNYAPMPLGHAGGLQYDPAKKYIYVATGDTGTYANEIVVINRQTMSIIDHFSVSGISTVKNFAFDRNNNVWYVASDTKIVKCDSNFNVLESWDRQLAYNGDYNVLHQSAFCYDGQYYIICDLYYTSADSITVYMATCILQMEEGKIVNTFEFVPMVLGGETQAACPVGDKLYLFTGQTWFIAQHIDMARTEMRDTPGTESYRMIDSNSDLDDFKIPGKYFIGSQVIAATITNVPTSTQGGMEILVTSQGNWIKQQAITNNGRCWCRVYQASNGIFSPWIRWDNNLGYASLMDDLTIETGVAFVGGDVYVSDTEVQINGRITFSALAADTWTELFTVPSGYRISAGTGTEYFPAVTLEGNEGVATIRVQSNGKVAIFAHTAGATDCRVSIRYRIGS